MPNAPNGGVVASLELTALAEDLLRQRLRRERSDITDDEIDVLVCRWYERRPGAEQGDAVGRPRRIA